MRGLFLFGLGLLVFFQEVLDGLFEYFILTFPLFDSQDLKFLNQTLFKPSIVRDFSHAPTLF